MGDGATVWQRHGRFRQERDMSCNMFNVWQHKTAVILQSLSHLSYGLDSKAVHVRRHAGTMFHLHP